MDTQNRDNRTLQTARTTSPTSYAKRSVQRLLDERMSLSEAIDAAGLIIGAFPNGGANAGDSYIGALAATLGSYPRSVAKRCADHVHGVSRDCKFLPTVADIVAWCERHTE